MLQHGGSFGLFYSTPTNCDCADVQQLLGVGIHGLHRNQHLLVLLLLHRRGEAEMNPKKRACCVSSKACLYIRRSDLYIQIINMEAVRHTKRRPADVCDAELMDSNYVNQPQIGMAVVWQHWSLRWQQSQFDKSRVLILNVPEYTLYFLQATCNMHVGMSTASNCAVGAGTDGFTPQTGPFSKCGTSGAIDPRDSRFATDAVAARPSSLQGCVELQQPGGDGTRGAFLA